MAKIHEEFLIIQNNCPKIIYIYIWEIETERDAWASLVGARGSHWPLESVSLMAAIENWNGERKKEEDTIHQTWFTVIEDNQKSKGRKPRIDF